MLPGMIQTPSTLVSRIALAVAIPVGICTAVLAAAQSAGTQSTPARPALFTDAQATSGEAVYRQSCAGCHGATLTGGIAPPLTGPAFETSWSHPLVTLADIFFIARTTMPPRSSGSLTAQDHAAVFAYILRTNGFPSGATTLTAASEKLESEHLRSEPGVRAAARPAPPAFIPGAPGAPPPPPDPIRRR